MATKMAFKKQSSSRKEQKVFQVDKEIKISKTDHDALVKHVKERLDWGKEIRDLQAAKFEKIDRDVYGYLVLDHDDEKRIRDNEKGFGVKPVDQKLPLTWVQLDEAITFILEVLQTDAGLYGAMAPREKQAVATGFSALMNEHADKFKHIRELVKFLFNTVKYNSGALIPEWKRIYGNKIKNKTAGVGIDIQESIVYEGNNLTSADMYNLIYDPSVNPVSLATEGEFFALVDVLAKFKVERMEQNEEIYNVDGFIKNTQYPLNYYKEKPVIRADIANSLESSWFKILGANSDTKMTAGIEFVYLYIWLDGKKFGLEQKDEKMGIWRVTLANNSVIARAQKLHNAHGQLPIGYAMPNEDDFREATKSYAELLSPFNMFASSQMNVHQKSNRKALYGLTFYNTNVLDLGDNFDPVAGKVPVSASPDVDIRKAIYQAFDAPNTDNTLRDVGNMIDLMQKILPTDILRQVAGLDRATQYHAAATVQGGNRRNLKIARIIDAQAFSAVRGMQMYNILQYQKTMEILTPEGELIEIDPTEFRDTKLEFAISDGLRGLDRLTMVMNIKEVLNAILQSQQASAQIDVVAAINYWTSLLGDKTDFSQFRFKSPIDALPPEQKNLAYQLLQQFAQQQQQEGATQ